MPSVLCRFCVHDNPAGAKFCNECGSPLHLKPCPRCEAITELNAGQCHQCGASFDLEAVAAVASGDHAAAVADPPVSSTTRAADNTPIVLAERFDAEAGSTRNASSPDRPRDHGPNDARDRPRDHGPNDDPARRRTSEPQARSNRRRAVPPATSPSVTRRKPATYAALLGVACVIGVGAYFAYVGEVPFRLPGADVASMKAPEAALTGSPPTAAATRAASPRSGAPATTDAVAEVAAAPSAKPDAAPAVPAAAAPRSPAGAQAPSQARRIPAAAKRANARDTSATAAPAERSVREHDKDAAATQRLIARDLAGFTPPPNAQNDAERPRSQ